MSCYYQLFFPVAKNYSALVSQFRLLAKQDLILENFNSITLAILGGKDYETLNSHTESHWFFGREELIHEKLQQKLYKTVFPICIELFFFRYSIHYGTTTCTLQKNVFKRTHCKGKVQPFTTSEASSTQTTPRTATKSTKSTKGGARSRTTSLIFSSSCWVRCECRFIS